jgi:hypothetical protein
MIFDRIINEAMLKKNEILHNFIKEKLENCKLHIEDEAVEICQSEDGNQYWIEFHKVKVSPILHFKTELSEDNSKYILTACLLLNDRMRIEEQYSFN